MACCGWNLLGGYRQLGGSLCGEMDSNTADGFGIVLETGLALVLVNVKGLGGQGR